MNSARFSRIRELFEAVIDLPEEARSRRLAELCGDDAIRNEVVALISRDKDQATGAYANNLEAMLGKASAPALHPGDNVGVWKVAGLIGEGGMGSVYAVERSDGQFTQKAALKLLRGLPGADALAAFTRERQIMAGFSHPNIARLLDGGTTAHGLPYLVMEQIAGEPLDEHMRSAALNPRQRLQLFRQICEAVAFAHSQLVIHCDLKPSNILVTQDGRPILLDFGIAALLDSDGDSSSGRRQAFTPRYASPELREGGVINTATDVFSLGRILADMMDESLAGDLQAIIARATAPDARGRYQSAALLAKDIDHYLSLEPVEARPRTALYVLQRLVRRRWLLFVFATGVMVMATFFVWQITDERNSAVEARNAADAERLRAETALGEVSRQRDRAQQAEGAAKRERDLTLAAEQRIASELNRAIRAEQEAAEAAGVARRETLTAQKVSDFLESIFMSADPDNIGRQDVSAYSLLVRARERVNKDLATEPAVRSRIIERLAMVHEKIGRPMEAARIYDEAIDMERRAEPQHPGRLSSLLIYAALFKANNKLPGPAEEQARESLALREAHEPPRSHRIAQSLDMLALVISGKGRHEEAIPLMQRALAIRELRTGHTPDDEIASSHHNLGVVYRRMGNYARALEHYEIGTNIQAKRLGKENPRYLNTAEQFGLALGLAGRTNEGLTHLRHAFETRLRLQGERSARTALSARELAIVQALAGQHAEAVKTLRKGTEISRITNGVNSPVYAGIIVLLAESLAALGGEGNLREAESLFAEALAINAKILPPEDPWMADAQFSYGRYLLRQGQAGQALIHLQEAERIRNVALAEDNPFRSQATLLAAVLLLESGQLAAARSRLEVLRPQLSGMFTEDRERFATLVERIGAKQ